LSGSRRLVPRTSRPLAILVRRLSFRQRRGSCGIIGSTMWKRLLAGIFGLIGLVVWKSFLGHERPFLPVRAQDGGPHRH
jgi:hypothetical protein